MCVAAKPALANWPSTLLVKTKAAAGSFSAQCCGLPFLRIDPLKADVGRVADVMSVHYAESRCALPLQLTPHEVVIATGREVGHHLKWRHLTT